MSSSPGLRSNTAGELVRGSPSCYDRAEGAQIPQGSVSKRHQGEESYPGGGGGQEVTTTAGSATRSLIRSAPLQCLYRLHPLPPPPRTLLLIRMLTSMQVCEICVHSALSQRYPASVGHLHPCDLLAPTPDGVPFSCTATRIASMPCLASSSQAELLTRREGAQSGRGMCPSPRRHCRTKGGKTLVPELCEADIHSRR